MPPRGWSKWFSRFGSPDTLPTSRPAPDRPRSRRTIPLRLEQLEGRINPGVVSPPTLAFLTPAQTLTVNSPSSVITVGQFTLQGTPDVATSPVTLTLSSTSPGALYLDTNQQPLANPTITIPTGSNKASFEYEDSQLGQPTLTVTEQQLPSVTTSQVETVNPVLAFLVPPQTILANQPSSPITVQLQDASGHAVQAPTGGLTLNLSSTSTGGKFLNHNQPITTLTVPGGANTVSFEYEDSQIGLPTLTASEQGQSVSVSQLDAVGLSLAFLTPPQTTQAGQPSGTITLQLQSASGKPVQVPVGSVVTLNLSSTSSGATFLEDGQPSTVLTIAGGSSTASFEYADLLAEVSTVTATGLGLSATQSETTFLKQGSTGPAPTPTPTPTPAPASSSSSSAVSAGTSSSGANAPGQPANADLVQALITGSSAATGQTTAAGQSAAGGGTAAERARALSVVVRPVSDLASSQLEVNPTLSGPFLLLAGVESNSPPGLISPHREETTSYLLSELSPATEGPLGPATPLSLRLAGGSIVLDDDPTVVKVHPRSTTGDILDQQDGAEDVQPASKAARLGASSLDGDDSVRLFAQLLPEDTPVPAPSPIIVQAGLTSLVFESAAPVAEAATAAEPAGPGKMVLLSVASAGVAGTVAGGTFLLVRSWRRRGLPRV
jgi:hypothetical protein